MDKNKISRRNFIAQNAALAGTALVSTAFISAGMSSKKIRIGIVGGRFGSTFQWHEHPDCVVEAVSDLRQDRRDHLMKTYKCNKSYPSLEEMVKDKNIDAIGVFTGAPDHVKHTIECMKHGKHVLCAVPACLTLDEAEQLSEAVKKYGLTYMMAETGYYQQHTISARKMFRNGEFGDLYYVESEYQHDGLENLYFENGQKTWRYGMAPMLYPTHSTSLLTGVTGERLTEVVCQGWGDDAQCLKDNVYNNPFWNECAFFKTDRGTSFRVNIWWKGAHLGGERANWIGTRMSFYADNGRSGPALVKKSDVLGKDDAGFVQSVPGLENYEQPQWWSTDMLPEPLRHNSGHHGSHTFLTHEFIDALVNERKPSVDINEALAYTVPGIIAHDSALKGGVQLKIPQFS
jgi:predicted dehydrogenase